MTTVQARRDVLIGVKKPNGSLHRGLWLDRFLPSQEKAGDRVGEADQKSEGSAKAQHLKEVASIPEPPEYDRAFERWKASLEQIKSALEVEKTPTGSEAWTLQLTTAECEGRMVVGLGIESPLETSITLNRTWGMPMIPGSALKGLAAATAHRLLDDPAWQKADHDADGLLRTAHQIVFGDTRGAGYVTFHDAWYVPNSAKRCLELDTITVHHPAYYRGNESPPADSDSPDPIPFITAQGNYLIAVSGPKEWVQATLRILATGLHSLGIGAKTSSGYGRLTLPGIEPIGTAKEEEERVEAARAEAERKEAERQAALDKEAKGIDERRKALIKLIETTGKDKFPERAKEMMESLKSLPPEYMREVAPILLRRAEAVMRPEKLPKKPWYLELREIVGSDPGITGNL